MMLTKTLVALVAAALAPHTAASHAHHAHHDTRDVSSAAYGPTPGHPRLLFDEAELYQKMGILGDRDTVNVTEQELHRRTITKEHTRHSHHEHKKRGGQCAFPTNEGLVSVDPSGENAGWAMSPDQPCEPGKYCPYACPPGQLMGQWDPKATSYSYPLSMNGGMFCNKNGEMEKPFPNKPCCYEGTGTFVARNKCGKQVSFCQTVLPGNEAMLIPTEVGSGSTAVLAVPDTNYWAGTAAHFYINPPGVDTATACVWGTLNNPWGNWSPYVAGANQDGNGNTFVKIAWNPIYLEPATPFRNTLPNWGVRVVCDEGSNCNGLPCSIDPRKNKVNEVTAEDAAQGDGASFCVVTAPKGSKAYIEVFEIGNDGNSGGNGGNGGNSGSSSSSSSAPASSSSAPASSSSAASTGMNTMLAHAAGFAAAGQVENLENVESSSSEEPVSSSEGPTSSPPPPPPTTSSSTPPPPSTTSSSTPPPPPPTTSSSAPPPPPTTSSSAPPPPPTTSSTPPPPPPTTSSTPPPPPPTTSSTPPPPPPTTSTTPPPPPTTSSTSPPPPPSSTYVPPSSSPTSSYVFPSAELAKEMAQLMMFNAESATVVSSTSSTKVSTFSSSKTTSTSSSSSRLSSSSTFKPTIKTVAHLRSHDSAAMNVANNGTVGVASSSSTLAATSVSVQEAPAAPTPPPVTVPQGVATIEVSANTSGSSKLAVPLMALVLVLLL
ncbi:YALIA101S01e19394g1_1 [Yarrowia lipolytica]|nr:Hypothetical protein YALI2_C00198g [Yarrowia lipolytica]SEI31288.1 YALIA101S01e19394g1_1 [Yarrowia lipolytica]